MHESGLIDQRLTTTIDSIDYHWLNLVAKRMVKTSDKAFFDRYGITPNVPLPAVIYFEQGENPRFIFPCKLAEKSTLLTYFFERSQYNTTVPD